MSGPAIFIRFDGNVRSYLPGEVLSGEVWLESVDAEEIRSVEVSVLWHTEGKGNEDFAVHDFRRLSSDSAQSAPASGESPESAFAKPAASRWTCRFQTALPNSPLSYDGAIIKLRWCVRVRVFLTRGREVVAQRRFRLGRVPPTRAVKPASAVTASAVSEEVGGSML